MIQLSETVELTTGGALLLVFALLAFMMIAEQSEDVLQQVPQERDRR